MKKTVARRTAFITASCMLFVAVCHADLLVCRRLYISRYDEKSGKLLSKIPTSSAQGVETVESVVPGPDGDYYAFGNGLGWGTVFRLDGVSGAYKNNFVAGDGINGPVSVAFGPGGDLFVSTTRQTNTFVSPLLEVIRYDGRTGRRQGLLIPRSQNVESRGRMAFGPNGRLYVSGARGDVLQFDGTTGEFISVVGSTGDTNGHLGDLHFGPREELYLVGSFGIFRLDLRTEEIRRVIDPAAAGMSAAYVMAVADDGIIYLGDGPTADVWRFDARTGASMGVFITREVPEDRAIDSMALSGPRLRISHEFALVRMTWPVTFGNFELQTSAAIGGPWQTVSNPPSGDALELTLQFTPAGNQLFRLMKK
jgi:hypothetical protein